MNSTPDLGLAAPQRPWSRSAVLELVAGWLTPMVGAQPSCAPEAAMPWEAIAEVASHHFVAPALGCTIGNDPRLPDHVRDYFQTLLELNRKRNEVILGGLDDALRALNDVGIRPGLLKGAAFLAERAYRDPGCRVMADIDLLVPKEIIGRASDALRSAGFVPPNRRTRTPAGHHHLPVQQHGSTGLGIELHHQPTERRWLVLVDASRSFAGGFAIKVQDTWATMPSPTDRAALIITHAQLSDRHHRRGVPHLRHLLDLAVLRRDHEMRIEWGEIERRFASIRLRDVLTDTLACEAHLFGHASPFEDLERDAKAIARMRQSLDTSSNDRLTTKLSWLAQDAWAALVSDPRRLIAALRYRARNRAISKRC